MKKLIGGFLLVSVGISLFFIQCGREKNRFSIAAGSENTILEPLLQDFARKNNIKLEIQYKGSVDIMSELQKTAFEYDAVWPANSMWVSIGDVNRRIKRLKSVMISPVAFGVRKSLADSLGWVGRDVRVMDILDAIRDKKLRFIMTSATQSNSGACAYIGFLYALAGSPEVMDAATLKKPELQSAIRQLLTGVHRSSGSSGWLKELFLKGDYDSMVNYEAVLIETNQELIKTGREPLYVIYPVDGVVLADSPLGYADRGNRKKEEIFVRLQEYLLSEEIQAKIMHYGRRTGFGAPVENTDKNVFNPDWGVRTDHILSPIKLPSSDVILEALNLYQTDFRKPSLTVYCLDFSGSMNGGGDRQLKEAMRMLLDQEIARRYFIQASASELIAVIPFSDEIKAAWSVEGNDSADLNRLLGNIGDLNPAGGTDIYSPVLEAFRFISGSNPGNYIPAVVLMTDGESNTGKKLYHVRAAWKSLGIDVPVFSIMFGKASREQLEDLANLTRGAVFDGREDLAGAFRKVKGYN